MIKVFLVLIIVNGSSTSMTMAEVDGKYEERVDKCNQLGLQFLKHKVPDIYMSYVCLSD